MLGFEYVGTISMSEQNEKDRNRPFSLYWVYDYLNINYLEKQIRDGLKQIPSQRKHDGTLSVEMQNLYPVWKMTFEMRELNAEMASIVNHDIQKMVEEYRKESCEWFYDLFSDVEDADKQQALYNVIEKDNLRFLFRIVGKNEQVFAEKAQSFTDCPEYKKLQK